MTEGFVFWAGLGKVLWNFRIAVAYFVIALTIGLYMEAKEAKRKKRRARVCGAMVKKN